MTDEIQDLYGNRLRVRACGLLQGDNSLLLINHQSITTGDFWAPPGGGVHFGESATGCLQREFQEETGLEIKVAGFLFACEFIKPPLHAIELFFTVTRVKGKLRLGQDPEMNPEHQILRDVKYLTWPEIAKMQPKALHGMFSRVTEPSQILQLTGYLKL